MRSPLYDFFVDRDSLNRLFPVAVASDKGISIRLFEDDGTADILVSKFRPAILAGRSMLVFFATLILLATLLYLWETRARLCKFCHPFYQSPWHFLPVQVFSGETTPAILQSCSTMLGASPSDGGHTDF